MVTIPPVNTYSPYNNYYTGVSNNSGYKAVYPNQSYHNYSPITKQNNQFDQLQVSNNYSNMQKSIKLKTEGNKLRLQKNYKEAINQYNEALKWFPEYTDVLYNLARTYRDSGNYDLAVKTFNKLLAITPNDYESRTILGEYYEELGSIDAALSEYQKVLSFEPKYDYARRNLENARIKKISSKSPDQAKQITQKTAERNLAKALELIQTNAPDYIKQNLQGITVKFGMTQEVNSYENLAQYENTNKVVLVSDKLTFAHPAIIATYIVHEAVHAGDKDPITSVREEQDAFREMTKFWIQNNNGLIDPDLTLAMSLFCQGPEKLDEKVADLYIKRDTKIKMTSPNHGEASNDGGMLSNLYDSLKSLIPVQGLFNLPNTIRNEDFFNHQSVNPFINNSYLPYQPIMYITPDLGLIKTR